ncbi:uncharacterized protein LOC118738354 [Rhagoletis pomonella]|uniref:uncharacterized protein LOC118738354 n=2 Tax=Rhagoletis pomonella TaxID=28610 RepID=UPI0017856311|nr:uncharacterized protein LOC118738354 [Rhagoletis pomonella]
MQVQDNCAFCLVSMKRRALKRLQPCRHLFNADCFENVPTATSCPICRSDVTVAESVERRANIKYSAEDRKRIVEAANKGLDWVQLAESLNVKYKTAYVWVSSGTPQALRRGGTKERALTDNEVAVMVQWIEEDATMTLTKIREKIKQTFRKDVCISSVGNYLQGQLFTMKGIHKEPQSMNSQLNKEKRREYVCTLNQYIQEGKQILYIDETNFNLFCRRSRGRAKVGKRAVQVLPVAKGPNVHLIGAIYASGVVKMTTRRGSFKSEDANAWLRSVLDRWCEMGNQLADAIIVCDNAPCHSKLHEVCAESTLLRLGPYSPMLNPIEIIWGKIKANVKSNIRTPDVIGPGVIEQRLQYLEGLIKDAAAAVNCGDCARSVQHSTSFHAAVISLDNMPVGQ